MKIAICEDDQMYSNYLIDLINQWSESTKVSVDISAYYDAEAYLMVMEEAIFDVLILDIEMKNMTGMELAKLVRRIDEDIIIIFITSHSSYSLEGYEVTPLHFLTKPVSQEQIFHLFDKTHSVYSLKDLEGIVVSSDSGHTRVLTDKILYISTMSHYTEIKTLDETYNAKMSQKELNSMLPSYFLPCHRAYIVNMMKVTAVFSDKVVLVDGTNIPVSRRQAKSIQERFLLLNTR
jgi:DNA-binding LytR/AlgR family response regulator